MAEGDVKKAGYVPSEQVTNIVTRFRDYGMSVPFTPEVLEKASVPASLAPRTLMALRLLGLVDRDGYPTDQFQAMKTVSSDQYQDVLQDWLRSVYADIFQFVNPATEPERVEDAFRGYEPHGQRGKMVSLFMGLCAFAGIITEAPKRGVSQGTVRMAAKRVGKTAAEKPKPRAGSVVERLRQQQDNPPPPGLDPLIAAYVAKLPKPGPWSRSDRDVWLTGIGHAFDLVYTEQKT